jgi:hypothetical protein
VLEPEEYERWLATGRVGPSMRGFGRRALHPARLRHLPPAGAPPPARVSPARAPALEGLFGARWPPDGRTVVADETYIRESILDPHAKIVAGWQPIMPTFKGQITEEQIERPGRLHPVDGGGSGEAKEWPATPPRWRGAGDRARGRERVEGNPMNEVKTVPPACRRHAGPAATT